ncbi:hypothetical protein [Nocardia crassostreae]|uniref:hypothetical protein n=1 Tax=Nocardia crassostreae TaxID=53428 RepID=UPI0008306282|nr:hypothetical protein [Nocardia crassostreae]
MADELSAFAGHGDVGGARRERIGLGGRIDNFGTYRFRCPTPGCGWFHDENTTLENPDWRQRVEAATDAHLAAAHPHWIHPEYD